MNMDIKLQHCQKNYCERQLRTVHTMMQVMYRTGGVSSEDVQCMFNVKTSELEVSANNVKLSSYPAFRFRRVPKICEKRL
jgi:hypothetical protein